MNPLPCIDRPSSLSQAIAVYEAMLLSARGHHDREAESRLSSALARLKTIRSRRDSRRAVEG